MQSTPVLSVPLSRCPPCYLHMVMALVRLLWNQLVFLAEMVQEAAEELVNFLQNILGMTLPPIEDEKMNKKNKKRKLAPRQKCHCKKESKEVKILKRTKFAYPDWVRVLENHG